MTPSDTSIPRPRAPPIPIAIPVRAGMHAMLTPLRRLMWKRAPPRGADLPSIVRAGSALRRWQGRWIVVQDDVRSLAAIDSMDAFATHVDAVPLLLPTDADGTRTFDDTRGNKAAKLDLEAAVVLPDGRLLVFGSGSTPARERVALLAPDRARLVAASTLYARMREGAHLQEREMNIEGAIVIANRVRVFNRAVGLRTDASTKTRTETRTETHIETRSATRARDPRDHPSNTTFDLDLPAFLAWLDDGAAPPYVENVIRYDLGRAEGAVIGFTDAALQHDGTVAFLACAELTGDPTVDGRVVATRFGVLDGAAGWQSEIVDEHGGRILDKLEGLEPDERPGCFHVVSDADDPGTPARIGGLVTGDAVRGHPRE